MTAPRFYGACLLGDLVLLADEQQNRQINRSCVNVVSSIIDKENE